MHSGDGDIGRGRGRYNRHFVALSEHHSGSISELLLNPLDGYKRRILLLGQLVDYVKIVRSDFGRNCVHLACLAVGSSGDGLSRRLLVHLPLQQLELHDLADLCRPLLIILQTYLFKVLFCDDLGGLVSHEVFRIILPRHWRR